MVDGFFSNESVSHESTTYSQALLNAIYNVDLVTYQSLIQNYQSELTGYSDKFCDSTRLLKNAVVVKQHAFDQDKQRNYFIIIKSLLDHHGLAPFDPAWHKPISYRTPESIFTTACRHGDLSSIKLLLASGLKITLLDLLTALHRDELDRDLSIFTYLVTASDLDLTWIFGHGYDPVIGHPIGRDPPSDQLASYNYGYCREIGYYRDDEELFWKLTLIDDLAATKAVVKQSMVITSDQIVINQFKRVEAIKTVDLLTALGLLNST